MVIDFLVTFSLFHEKGRTDAAIVKDLTVWIGTVSNSTKGIVNSNNDRIGICALISFARGIIVMSPDWSMIGREVCDLIRLLSTFDAGNNREEFS